MIKLSSDSTLIGVTVPDLPGNRPIQDICEELNGQVINFYTMDMDQLGIIAKHRILPVPTLLLLQSSKTILRIAKDIPTLPKLRKILSQLK